MVLPFDEWRMNINRLLEMEFLVNNPKQKDISIILAKRALAAPKTILSINIRRLDYDGL